ncbi:MULTISPECIES: hypothetical protein [unclassified Streptomyces]|uniref:hypothetical protein n=1 Tax=unclassified Streptomyces TaxID=2593676 RepID=UPI002E80EF6B|nr:hypothetical protein [Streptomyces sp. NBC_00589]WTI37102.1 hypothetical protein OIC96_19835 [Streptomyces sp. NBC_00775]WUB29222.1 hypothetical protein OHA51_29900 [Streptomyces sp. NBC_00589]
MPTQHDDRFRARHVLAIGGFVLALLAAGAAIVLLLGTWRGFVRETAPELLDRPGGPWAVGCVLGLATVLGALGGMQVETEVSGQTRLFRAVRVTGAAICWAAAMVPAMYMLGALSGKNCPSYQASCRYIPGTGSALLAYVASTALLGWCLLRWNSARTEARRAGERERLRRLRKKGRGKSRAAARRG